MSRDININPDTLLTSDLLLKNNELFAPDRTRTMIRTISLTSIDSDDSNVSKQSDDYVINKSEERDNDNQFAIDNLKKSNTILKKMLDRLITRDNLSDEEKQSILQDIKDYELNELSEYIMSLQLSMSNDDNEHDEILKSTIVSPSKKTPSLTKTRPITPGYPLIVPPIVEPHEDKDAYKKILERPQIVARKAKMTEDEKRMHNKEIAKKNKRLRIFKKAEEIMNEIEYQEKKQKELELKNGKKGKNMFFKYSLKDLDERITRKTAKNAIVKVKLQLSAGNQELAHRPLRPVEEKMLLSPYAAPICDQMLRNIVVETKATRK